MIERNKHHLALVCLNGYFRDGGDEVPMVDWCVPGENAAMEMLMGSKSGFLTKRIKGYLNDRNNPTKPNGLSCLSPYLHFGQISAQRCALEARIFKKSSSQVQFSFSDFTNQIFPNITI